MRRLFACLLALILVAAPFAARAEDGPVVAAPTVPVQTLSSPAGGLWGLTPGEALTVGVGVLAGVVVMDVLVGTTPALVAGAVAGALIGSWWFDSYGPTLKPITGASSAGTI